MKRTSMQTVVNYVNVQSDYLWEYIHDEWTHPEDRAQYLSELGDLCNFLTEAKDMGFDVSKSIYPLDKKNKLS